MPIDREKRTLITFAVDKDVKEKLVLIAKKYSRTLSNFLACEVDLIIQRENADNSVNASTPTYPDTYTP